MRDALRCDGTLEGVRDVRMDGYVSDLLGPVLPGESKHSRNLESNPFARPSQDKQLQTAEAQRITGLLALSAPPRLCGKAVKSEMDTGPSFQRSP